MPDAGDNCRKCRYLGMTHSLSNGAFISVPGCRRRAPSLPNGHFHRWTRKGTGAGSLSLCQRRREDVGASANCGDGHSATRHSDDTAALMAGTLANAAVEALGEGNSDGICAAVEGESGAV